MNPSICARCPTRPDVVIRRGDEWLCVECVKTPITPERAVEADRKTAPRIAKKRSTSDSSSSSEELVAKTRRVREELEGEAESRKTVRYTYARVTYQPTDVYDSMRTRRFLRMTPRVCALYDETILNWI